MRQTICTYLILGIILICTSCTNQYQVLFQQKNTLNDTSRRASEVAGEYRIRSQDILQVRNLQDAKRYLVNTTPSAAANANVLTEGNSGGNSASVADQTFQVSDDGNVILPALGPIKVAGYTRAEAQKIVEMAYRKNVLLDPIIELKIVNLKVTMFGEVKGPGNYPLTKDHTTLVEVIGAAGGITEKADESTIKIIRGTEKKPEVIVIDLGNIESVNDPRTVLQNGDIIYVARNKRASRNDNLQNFSTVFQPLLLLFNTVLIVLTLTRN